MEKKKLKKLSLQKEEVINLYDHEMNSLKGGTSPLTVSSEPCLSLISEVVSYLVSYAYETIVSYYQGQNRTNTNQDVITRGKTSDVYINTVCSLPEVEVICY
jgi:natural product precursor